MDDPKFRAGDISTNFMEYFLTQSSPKETKKEGWLGALAS
jgi:hypothetical protein